MTFRERCAAANYAPTCTLQHVLEHVCVAHALLHIATNALVALTRERVPEVDGGVAVAAAHDGRIPGVQVLHVTGQGHHVLESGEQGEKGVTVDRVDTTDNVGSW